MTPQRLIPMDLENLWRDSLNLKAQRPGCEITEAICGVIAQTQRTVLAQLEQIKERDQLAQGIAEAIGR